MTPPVKSVVAQIEFMSPAISNVPWVDNDCFFVPDKTSRMPDNWDDAADESLVTDCANSPDDADSIALTSLAVLSMTDRFRFIKSWIWSDAWAKARSRD